MRAIRLPRPAFAALAGVLLAGAWLVPLAPPAHANVSVIPYRSSDWRYQVYFFDPPGGWQLPGFDDSGFALGCAAFGTQGDCFITACTEWPLASRIVLRKTFDLPANTDVLTIGAAYDNEIRVYVNGVLVGSAGGPLEQCSSYNRSVFNAPASILQETGNVIAVLGTDYGVHNLLDLNVEAILAGPPPPPPPPSVPSDIYFCSATDGRPLEVILTWSDVEREDGYRIYRDGMLIGTTGVGEVTYADYPPIGTYGYCVQAYNDAGTSNQCCDFGTRVPIAVPSPCAASDGSSRQVVVSWANVQGEQGYRVYRDADLIYTAAPDETAYTDFPPPGTYAYCVRAFGLEGVSLPCCDSGTRLPLAYPSPCTASDDDPRQISFNWTDVEGEDGYHISRNGEPIHTAGPDETVFIDTPPPGTYSYCVQAFNADGVSASCCDTGTRPLPPGPAACQASDLDAAGVTFTWANVAGEEGYAVYRDGLLLETVGADVTSYFDVPEPGSYAYCVEAVYSYGTSPQCCDEGRRPALPAPTCAASGDLRTGVNVTWEAVEGADGYRVFRDNSQVFAGGPGETSYLDSPAPGTYLYCVEAFNAVGVSPRCCAFGTRLPLAVPSPCGASDGDPAGILVTWTDGEGEDGYRIFRDGSPIQMTGPDETSFWDVPPVGTYTYCVQALNAVGVSPSCCDPGTRPSVPPPAWCRASDEDVSGILFEWQDVSGEVGYNVYRDGVLVHAAAADEASFFDVPPIGSYSYCVEAVFTSQVSARCCDSGRRPALPVPGPCSASDDDIAGIRFTWQDVSGEQGYNVYRDGAPVHSAPPDETSFFDTPPVGDYEYCVEAVFASEVSEQCCDSGRRAALPAPGPCSATDDVVGGVSVTWTSVPGAEGYRIFRDAALVYTAGEWETSYFDIPALGTYTYCIEAFDATGASPRCCDSGRRPALPAPGPCSASDDARAGVTVTWTAVPGADGYRVFRGAVPVYVAGAGETSYLDVPEPGTYTYCVEAFDDAGASARCCDTGTRPGAGVPFACAASDTGSVGVLVTWTDVPEEDGYRVLRDGTLIHTAGPDETAFFDTPAVGFYLYCVEAFDGYGTLARCCDTGSRSGSEPVPGNGQVRLSWGTCSPQVPNQEFVGPQVYKLVVSAIGVGQTMLGHDTNILIHYGLQDAWRFDDAGCQGSSYWSATPQALSKTCPAMLGANALTITNYYYDTAAQHAAVRLAVTFDDITPAPGTRYTLWQVNFDHTYSVVGPGQPGVDCGGAEVGLFFDCDYSLILASTGQAVALQPTPGDSRLTWGGGAPVRVEKTTWGRVKGMYR